MEPLSKLRQVRIEKLKKIKSQGVNPYPAKFASDQNIAQARKLSLSKKVKVAGRIIAQRVHGGATFFDLLDESAKIQLYFSKESLGEKSYQFLENLDIGDFLGVEGRLFKTKAGELTIEVSSLTLLAKSLRPLPSKWHGLKDVEERYRKRYVDLIANPEVRGIFTLKAKVISIIRDFLDKRGFLEVETPILQPVYGGAAAKPFVTHHEALDSDFYLRISDELYLKRLMVGGLERVYEIGRDFRNEGIDRSHNPEFTMLEFYLAYANDEDLMTMAKDLMTEILKKTRGTLKIKHEDDLLDFTPPWPKVSFADVLKKETGIDLSQIDNEEDLMAEIKKKKIAMAFEKVVGMGPLLDTLYKKEVRPKIIQPTLIVDYPTAMIPLAKKKEDNPKAVEAFQFLAKGMELIKAYSELNDPIDQRQRWEEQVKLKKRGFEEAEVLDEDYIEALEYGMPPTGGFGLGIDRLVALLAGVHSIKETIIFPTLKPQK